MSFQQNIQNTNLLTKLHTLLINRNKLTRLKYLELPQNQVSTVAADFFNLRWLEWVELSTNLIPELDLKWSNFPHLALLNLTNTPAANGGYQATGKTRLYNRPQAEPLLQSLTPLTNG